jgi:hypothetical protein
MSLQIATAAINTARDGHFETVSGTDTRALLLEAPRTNALTYSNDFTNVAYTAVNVSAALNAVGPDGIANGASTVTENSANGNHLYTRPSGSFTANTTQTVSFFVKAHGRTRGRVNLANGPDNFQIDFDLTAGTVSTSVNGGGSVSFSRIVAYGAGWYRVAVAGKVNGASTTGTLGIILEDASGNVSYVGDGTSGLQFWCLQHEADVPAPSSPITTTTVAVTRATDSFSFPFPYTPQAMTVYTKHVEGGTTITGGRLWQISDAGVATPTILVAASGGYQASHFNGATSVSTASGPAPSVGDLVEIRMVLDATGAVLVGTSINGGAESVTAASGPAALAAAWSGNLLWLNSSGASNQGTNSFLAVKAHARRADSHHHAGRLSGAVFTCSPEISHASRSRYRSRDRADRPRQGRHASRSWMREGQRDRALLDRGPARGRSRGRRRDDRVRRRTVGGETALKHSVRGRRSRPPNVSPRASDPEE